MKLSLSLFERKPARTGSVIRSTVFNPHDAKMLREVNGKMLRSYQAAISDNLTADLQSSITSANAEVLTSVGPVRNRARTIERDDAYGAGIVRIYQDNVAGADPFPLEMKVGKWQKVKGVDGKPDSETFIEEEETNRKIEQAWADYGQIENCTVMGNMSRLEVELQMVSSIIRDGTWLMRHYPGFPNNKYGYAIEPIESDRVDQYYNRPGKFGGDNEIQFSREYDQYGAVINYHILTRHPGDVFTSWSGYKKYREVVRAELITEINEIRTRAGQKIGMSRLAPCIVEMHQLRQFDIAHLTAAIWSACKPLFMVQEFPTAMGEMVPDYIRSAIANSFGLDEDGKSLSDDEGDKEDVAEPGVVKSLPYGQKPFLVDPKFPVESAEGFTKDKQKKIAVGSGVPYFMLSQDGTGLSWSNIRCFLDHFHDTCEILANHIILAAMRPWFNRWLKYALLSGQLDLPFTRYEEFCKAASFRGRCWPYLQPVQDVEADLMFMEAGGVAMDTLIRKRGGKGKHEVNAQIASDKACDAAHGLDFSNVTLPTVKKGQAGPGPDDDTNNEPQPQKKNG